MSVHPAVKLASASFDRIISEDVPCKTASTMHKQWHALLDTDKAIKFSTLNILLLNRLNFESLLVKVSFVIA
jgi:hypothetical protein